VEGANRAEDGQGKCKRINEFMKVDGDMNLGVGMDE